MTALGVVSFALTFLLSRGGLLVASVLGDVVHAFLHWADDRADDENARNPPVLAPLLRAIGGLHRRHHAWIDRRYAVHPERFLANVLFHQVPEQGMQVALCGVVSWAFALDAGVWFFCVAHLGVHFVDVVRKSGLDRDHTAHTPLSRPASPLFVDAAFHALHHVHPRHFLSARLVVVDRVFGTLLPLAGQRALVVAGTGDAAAFARALGDALVGAGAAVTVVADVDVDDACDHDVIVVAHDADRYADVLTRAQRARARALAPLFFFSVGESAAWTASAPVLVNERTVWRTLRRGPSLGAARALFCMKRGLSI